MADVILSTDSLTVLGGPASIDLEVDFGPEGQRGSNIFVGNGDPNLSTTEIGQDPLVFDLYINILTTDEDYLAVYQYQNADGSETWTKLFKLLPNFYSQNYTESFTAGVWEKNLPVSAIIPLDQIPNISSSNFNIQYNILGSEPISSSLEIGEIATEEDLLILPLTIRAIKYSSGTWSNLTGQQTVQLFITVV